MIVFDLTNQQTFQRAVDWIEELHQNTDPDTVIALVGNKCDLEESRQLPREVESKDLPGLCGHAGIGVLRVLGEDW